MPLANLEPQTQRVYPPTDLPGISDGDWIDISTIYTSGMRRRATQKAMGVGLRDLEGRQADTSFDVWAFKHALAEEVIIGWSDPSPISLAAIESMRPEVLDWVMSEFDRLIGERTEDEKKEYALSSRNGQ